MAAARTKKKAPDASTPGASRNTHDQHKVFANKTQAVTALRLALLANAYWPIPIKAESKKPGLDDWPNIVATKEIIQG
jgi:hypothetical protein